MFGSFWTLSFQSFFDAIQKVTTFQVSLHASESAASALCLGFDLFLLLLAYGATLERVPVHLGLFQRVDLGWLGTGGCTQCG